MVRGTNQQKTYRHQCGTSRTNASCGLMLLRTSQMEEEDGIGLRLTRLQAQYSTFYRVIKTTRCLSKTTPKPQFGVRFGVRWRALLCGGRDHSNESSSEGRSRLITMRSIRGSDKISSITLFRVRCLYKHSHAERKKSL